MRSRSAPRRGPTRRCSTRAGTRRPRTPRRSGWPTTPGSSRWSRSTPPTTAPPAEQTAQLWAERTPAGFTFNIKAFSLLTGHPTKVSALYKDLRPETDKKNVYPDDLPPQAYEEVWTRFLSALDPLVEAGKLGALLFQFPPWFTIRRSNKEYLLEVAAPLPAAAAGLRVPQRVLVRRRQPRGDAGLPARAPAAVRLRGHAAGPQVVGPAGAGRHRRPRGGALPRPQRQVDQQGHPREVRLPVLRRGSWPTGRRSCGRWPTRPTRRTCCMNNCYSRLRPAQRDHPDRAARAERRRGRSPRRRARASASLSLVRERHVVDARDRPGRAARVDRGGRRRSGSSSAAHRPHRPRHARSWTCATCSSTIVTPLSIGACGQTTCAPSQNATFHSGPR